MLPAGVKLVLEAVCVLMGVKPARVKDPTNQKFVESYAAASQKMLADKDFMNSLL
jgi:dynein heavy chain